MKYVICFLLILNVLSAEEPRTTAKSTVWYVRDDVSLPPDINPYNFFGFIDKLSSLHIKVVPKADWDKTISNVVLVANKNLINRVEPKSTETMWKGRSIKLVVVGENLRLYPNRPVTALSDLSVDEKVEMEMTTIKMGTLFQKVIGFADFIRWIPVGESAGQEGENIYFEFIPGALESEDSVNLVKIVQAHVKVLMPKYDMNHPSPSGLCRSDLEKIKALAPSILAEEVPFEKPSYSHWGNGTNNRLAETAQYVGEVILNTLFERGEPVIAAEEEVSPKGPLPNLSKPVKPVTECAFCNTKVIDQSYIAKNPTATHRVLVNYRPYISEKIPHFMVVTNCHKNNGDFLTREEIIDKYSLWEKIGSIFTKEMGFSGYRIITRYGRGVRQSVPHIHDHLVNNEEQAIPILLYNLYREYNKMPIPTLTVEQRKAFRDEWESYFN